MGGARGRAGKGEYTRGSVRQDADATSTCCGDGEREGHILEPAWTGTRVLVRVGHPEPHFVGYEGKVAGPRELYDAIVAETQCSTAILDGVLVDGWKDESDLEVDEQGNAYTRQFGGRQIFAAFDILV